MYWTPMGVWLRQMDDVERALIETRERLGIPAQDTMEAGMQRLVRDGKMRAHFMSQLGPLQT